MQHNDCLCLLQEQDVPLRTMLEVLLKHHKDRMTKKERVPSITSEVTSTSSTPQSPQDQGSLRKSEERKKKAKAKKMETRGRRISLAIRLLCMAVYYASLIKSGTV